MCVLMSAGICLTSSCYFDEASRSELADHMLASNSSHRVENLCCTCSFDLLLCDKPVPVEKCSQLVSLAVIVQHIMGNADTHHTMVLLLVLVSSGSVLLNDRSEHTIQ